LNSRNWINTGDGDNVIYGDVGNDTITTGAGVDQIYALAGDDTIDAGAGNDLIYGAAGSDTIVGGLGRDIIYAGTSCTGGGAAAYLNSVFGDPLPGQTPDAAALAGDNAYLIYGDIGADFINVRFVQNQPQFANDLSNDVIYALAGSDNIAAGDGMD